MVSTQLSACAYSGCTVRVERQCSACGRSFCRRHVLLEYGANYSFYRCASCQQRLDAGADRVGLIVVTMLVLTGLLLLLTLGLSAGGLIGVVMALVACVLLARQWRRL